MKRHVCHYDPLSQIVRLKKAKSKRTSFCLYVTCEKNANKLQYNLSEKLVRINCIVAGDKFAMKALLCNTQYFYVIDNYMYLRYTHTECIVVPTAKWLLKRAKMLRCTYISRLVEQCLGNCRTSEERHIERRLLRSFQ